MDIDVYRNRILSALGHPTVKVELTTEQLDNCINSAFEEIEPYITDTQLVTVPYSNRIDMSQYDVDYVVSVYKSPLSEVDPSIADYPYYEFYLSMDSISGLIEYYAAHKLSLSFKDRMSYRFVKPYLYVDMAPPITSTITVEYVPELKDVSSVNDPLWISLIYRLALANAKEVLGRVRGKYRVQGSPVELDPDTLLNEAQSEKESIRQKLDEIAYTFFPTD